ncbi:MAG: hypothetical protein K1X71_04510 [Pirellulales bacterium]|nr:hypothetical protein [Pirellulales bacterium]
MSILPKQGKWLAWRTDEMVAKLASADGEEYNVANRTPLNSIVEQIRHAH